MLDDDTAPIATVPLSDFEMPAALAKYAVKACRRFNSTIDEIFYDVPALRAELGELDAAMARQGKKLPSRILTLDAIEDPEGSLLLIDVATPPYVHRFTNVERFLVSPHPEPKAVTVATITGVGSSALGSAALAWSLSKSLAAPVLAIVPGYGVADVVLQGLGGWFGFGLHDFLGAKAATQNVLASVAPASTAIGRALPGSIAGADRVNGAPVFRFGSGSSDVLHKLLQDLPGQFRLLVGHSKGALQIGNALGSLDPDRTEGVRVVTLGCPIAESALGLEYHQYLGLYDALGQFNMWGHWLEHWPPTWHSTNPVFPPAMPAGKFARDAETQR